MKRILALLLVTVLSVFAFASCTVPAGNGGNEGGEGDGVTVMTHAEYVAAGVDKEVTIETYIQAKQGWWFNDKVQADVATFYTQDKDGGYFIYDMPCTKEEYDKLTVGTKIRVKGYTTAWSDMYEIINATFEIIEGDTYVAEPTDVTAKLGTEELINYQTMYIAVKDATVVAKVDTEGNEHAFYYKWNNAGSEGDDIYFDISVDGKTYTFVIESYLTGASTDVYKAAQALKVGDVVDLAGYLYWYEGPQAHVVSITAAE